MNKKLKDWYTDNHGDEREKRVKEVFSKWYKRNLVIVRGEGRTVEDIFGLPYTSSSDFAALWNCQAKAYYKDDERFFFEYIAITEDFDIIVGLQTENEEETKEIWIGYCIIPLTYSEFVIGVENNIAKANCNKLNIGEYEEKQKQIYNQIRADAIDGFAKWLSEQGILKKAHIQIARYNGLTQK